MFDSSSPDFGLVFVILLAFYFRRSASTARPSILASPVPVTPVPTLQLVPRPERSSAPEFDYLNLLAESPTAKCLRVTAFTIALARHYGLTGHEVRVIAWAAYLRGVGYSGIPPEILHKQGPLTLAELRIKRGHCEHGYKILRKVTRLAASAEIVHAQHERWDGSGYPKRLRGEEIPLGARLLAVAEMLESITSRSGRSPSQAIAVARWEIELSSGHRLDPECVQMFLNMPTRIWSDLRREIGGRTPV